MELSDEIDVNPTKVRVVSELLLTLSIVRERVVLIRQQLAHVRFLDEKIASFDFRHFRELKKKYWKLSDAEKVSMKRAILAKRKKFLNGLDLDNLQKETEKHLEKYQDNLSKIYETKKDDLTNDVDRYVTEGLKSDGALMRILHILELAQRQYISIIYETINNKG